MNINRQSHFSNDGKHRLWLLRSWEENPKMILFIGLNPSTANDINDDPTIRSCIRLTRHNGYGGFVICNLFSFVTANPKILIQNMKEARTVESDITLHRMIIHTHKTICAWGSWTFINVRAQQVLARIREPFCLGVNADGHPKHPLYIRSETLFVPYQYKKS